MLGKLFETIPPQMEKQIYSWPVDSQCLLYKRRKIESATNKLEDNQYLQIFLKIQIRKNYVLQLNSEGSQIVSGFECNIDKTFKQIRVQTTDAEEVGELLGIEFRSEKFNIKNIFMYIHEENKKIQTQNLQRFSQLLGKKYILQDGFHEVYRAIKKIGKGVTASVYKAVRLTDRLEVAVKSFKKQIYFQVDNGKGKAAFEKQFKTMTEIDSPYICKLISVYESDNSIYIVMELLTRSLYAFLRIVGFPKINLAKEIMVKLLFGLAHIHSKNIMHRDLKLQNIMVYQKDLMIEPKLIDFGLAEKSYNPTFLYLKCGTPGYVAPQILSLKANELPSPPYSHRCDIFSMGVIFYILLAGKTVFEGADERQVVRKNRECDIDYEFKNEKRLTDQMKDLLRRMLQRDPKERASVEDLLNHPFFEQVECVKQFKTLNTVSLIEQTEIREKKDQ